jgi:tryptophan-rich sensory protein
MGKAAKNMKPKIQGSEKSIPLIWSILFLAERRIFRITKALPSYVLYQNDKKPRQSKTRKFICRRKAPADTILQY